jgi:hypothetical protein
VRPSRRRVVQQLLNVRCITRIKTRANPAKSACFLKLWRERASLQLLKGQLPAAHRNPPPHLSTVHRCAASYLWAAASTPPAWPLGVVACATFYPAHPLPASCTPPADNACRQSAPRACRAVPPAGRSVGTGTKAARRQSCRACRSMQRNSLIYRRKRPLTIAS